jgi:hypothetical protein
MKETRKVWESLPSEKHQQLEKKRKKMFGENNPKRKRQQAATTARAADSGRQRGFQGVPDDRQAHSRFSGLQQVSGVPDDRQAHSGFSGFRVCSGFQVFQTRASTQRVFRFSAEFQICSRFILESANRDRDLDALDKEASRGAIMPEKSGSTESEWWEEKTGQAEGCHG